MIQNFLNVEKVTPTSFKALSDIHISKSFTWSIDWIYRSWVICDSLNLEDVRSSRLKQLSDVLLIKMCDMIN